MSDRGYIILAIIMLPFLAFGIYADWTDMFPSKPSAEEAAYNDGYVDGLDNGYDAGYDAGYEEGYQEEESLVSSEALDYTSRMWAIFDEQDLYTPEEALEKMLNLMQKEDAAMRLHR